MTYNTINGNNETIEQIKQHHKDKAFDQSIKLSEELLSIPQELEKPQRYQALYHLGHGLKAQKNIIQAKEVFTILDQDYSHRFEGLQGLFQIASNEKDWQTAIAIGQDCVDRFPDRLPGYFWLGNAYKNLAEYDKAEEQFKRIQEKFPDKQQGWEGMVRIGQAQQNWDQVIDYSEFFVKKFTENFWGYFWLGNAYKNLAEYDKAEKQFKLMQENFPNEPKGWEGMIQIGNDKNEWQQSYDASLNAIEHFPGHISFYNQKGMALKNLKRFDEAEEFFTELKRQFPDSEIPYIGLANVYSTLRKWKDAIYTLQQCLIYFPTRENVAKKLINQLLQYNEPDDALSIFNQYITTPDNIYNQLLLARIGQIREGNQFYLDELEKLYEQHPDEIPVALTYANALINFTMEEE